MRNLIKKSLAFLLVAALALTCFVGTLTVSAENPTATITITADAVEAGATEIPVTLTVESEVGINEALIKVSSDLGDIIAQPIVVVNEGVGTAIADNAGNATDYNAFYLSAVSPDGQAETVMGEITKATIKVVFTNEAGIAAKETPYTVNVEIPEGKVIAASKDEVAIDLVCEGLEIVVEEAVTECEHVKDAAVYVANETTGCYDAVVNCATCDEEMIRVETNIPSTTTVNAGISQQTYVNVYTSVGICTVITKSELSAYSSYSIRYSRLGTDGAYNFAKANDETTKFLKYTSKKDYTIYSNIGLYQMNLPVSISVCGYDANGNLVAVSAPYVTTITDEMWLLYTADNATQVNKTAYVDLVQMGTDAQAYFAKQGGADCDLATVAYPIDTYAFDTADATQETPNYDLSAMPNTISPAASVSVGGKTCVLSNSVNLSAGAPAISYMIRRGASVTDPSLWSMSITYTDAYGDAQVKTVTGVELLTSGTYAYFNYSPALYDSNKTVTNVISYNGSVIYTSEYSVETYIAATLPTITDDIEFTNILTSIAKFGQSIRANFSVE